MTAGASEEVAAANEAFYAAVERGDLDALQGAVVRPTATRSACTPVRRRSTAPRTCCAAGR